MNKTVFGIFDCIRQVPRPSLKEEQISQWLVDFAAENSIECERDDAMNVVMRVPATPGYENKDSVILQAHMDMVCEKDEGVEHDFLHDPIQTYVEGDWMKAHGTTLGADDGIGISMALAILTNPNLQHPAIEALFTTDEETGMSGAKRLKKGLLHGKRVINLDNEDDGQICIGSAGSMETVGRMHYTACQPEYAEPMFGLRLVVTGLLGGHSGEDINKGRATANKVLVNFLYSIRDYDWFLASIHGGNLDNAIAREAKAELVVKEKDKHELIAAFNRYKAEVEQEFGALEKDMVLNLDSCDNLPTTYICGGKDLIKALYECPHGVVAMSQAIPGLVETSTNLSSIKMKEDEKGFYIEVVTLQRSSVDKELMAIQQRVAAALALGCDEVEHNDGTPGWNPNPQSPLLQQMCDAYNDLYGQQPVVRAIHAGLECGLFLLQYPDWDIVSVGPQLYDVHSPMERLSLSSTDRTYDWLCHTLEKM